jgi:hypothetical protein
LKLATTQSIVFLRDRFHPHSDYEQFERAAAAANPYGAYTATPPLPLLPSQILKNGDRYAEGGYEAMAINFLLIGQCLWALVLATLSGTLARFATSRGDRA